MPVIDVLRGLLITDEMFNNVLSLRIINLLCLQIPYNKYCNIIWTANCYFEQLNLHDVGSHSLKTMIYIFVHTIFIFAVWFEYKSILLFSFCKIRMHWFLALLSSSWLLPEVEIQRMTIIAMAEIKKTKDKNNDLKNTKQKIKDREPWTPLNLVCEIRCSVRVSSSCSTCGIRRVTLVTNPVIRHEWGNTGLWLRQTENIHVVSCGIDMITNVMVTVNLSMFYSYIAL